MKVTADTNVLVRAWTEDHAEQSCEGSWLGADTFISFDKKAVKLMAARGKLARLLS